MVGLKAHVGCESLERIVKFYPNVVDLSTSMKDITDPRGLISRIEFLNNIGIKTYLHAPEADAIKNNSSGPQILCSIAEAMSIRCVIDIDGITAEDLDEMGIMRHVRTGRLVLMWNAGMDAEVMKIARLATHISRDVMATEVIERTDLIYIEEITTPTAGMRAQKILSTVKGIEHKDCVIMPAESGYIDIARSKAAYDYLMKMNTLKVYSSDLTI